MCVCRSIRPGMPVYFRRSITCAPCGTALLPEPTAVMRSPSTTTTASAIVFDPSQSLPKRIAVVWAAAGAAAIAIASRAPSQDGRVMVRSVVEACLLHLDEDRVRVEPQVGPRILTGRISRRVEAVGRCAAHAQIHVTVDAAERRDDDRVVAILAPGAVSESLQHARRRIAVGVAVDSAGTDITNN